MLFRSLKTFLGFKLRTIFYQYIMNAVKKEKTYEIVISDIEALVTDIVLKAYFKKFGDVKSVNFTDTLENFVLAKRIAKVVLTSRIKRSELAKIRILRFGPTKALLQSVRVQENYLVQENMKVFCVREDTTLTINELDLKRDTPTDCQLKSKGVKELELEVKNPEIENPQVSCRNRSESVNFALSKSEGLHELILKAENKCQKNSNPDINLNINIDSKKMTILDENDEDSDRAAVKCKIQTKYQKASILNSHNVLIVPQLMDQFEVGFPAMAQESTNKHSKYEFIKYSSRLKTGANNYRFSSRLDRLPTRYIKHRQVKTKYGVVITDGRFVDSRWTTTDTPQKKEAKRQRIKYLPYKKGPKRSMIQANELLLSSEMFDQQDEFHRILELTSNSRAKASTRYDHQL